MKGSEAGFDNCPHCGLETEFVRTDHKAYVICSDHNCWGGMDASWGFNDDGDAIIAKMRRNFNRREKPNFIGLDAAIRGVEKLREEVYQANQEPDCDEYCGRCVDVLDEALQIMSYYTK